MILKSETITQIENIKRTYERRASGGGPAGGKGGVGGVGDGPGGGGVRRAREAQHLAHRFAHDVAARVQDARDERRVQLGGITLRRTKGNSEKEGENNPTFCSGVSVAQSI